MYMTRCILLLKKISPTQETESEADLREEKVSSILETQKC